MICTTEQKFISCLQTVLEHAEDVSLTDPITLLPVGNAMQSIASGLRQAELSDINNQIKACSAVAIGFQRVVTRR